MKFSSSERGWLLSRRVACSSAALKSAAMNSDTAISCCSWRLPGASPSAARNSLRRFHMLALPARDLRSDAVEFHRFGQLAQAEERLQRQFVGRLHLPEDSLGRGAGVRAGAVRQVVSGEEFALRRVRAAIRRGQRRLARIFLRRPVRMPGLAVHFGQRRVDAVQFRELLECLLVERIGAAELPGLDARIGQQGRQVRGVRVGFLQELEGAAREALVAHAEAVPSARIVGRHRGELAKLRRPARIWRYSARRRRACRARPGSWGRPPGPFPAGRSLRRGSFNAKRAWASASRAGSRIGVRLENRLQVRYGLALLPGHVLGQRQVEQQPRVSRQPLHQLLVNRNGLLVPARGHQLLGSLRLAGLLLRLPPQSRHKTKKGEPQCGPPDRVDILRLPLQAHGETNLTFAGGAQNPA